jgi:hypothetical protein
MHENKKMRQRDLSSSDKPASAYTPSDEREASTKKRCQRPAIASPPGMKNGTLKRGGTWKQKKNTSELEEKTTGGGRLAGIYVTADNNGKMLLALRHV